MDQILNILVPFSIGFFIMSHLLLVRKVAIMKKNEGLIVDILKLMSQAKTVGMAGNIVGSLGEMFKTQTAPKRRKRKYTKRSK